MPKGQKVDGGRVNWKTNEFQKKVKKAVEEAIKRSAIMLQKEVRRELGRQTYPPSGPAFIGPPAKRTGILQGSIDRETFPRGDSFVGRVGNRKGPASPYARIQELGGTIAHPGGTPYVTLEDGATFVTKARAAELSARGFRVRYTRPHTITLPPRPYLRPALDRMRPDIVRNLKRAGGRLR
jgi:hypothetical protein